MTYRRTLLTALLGVVALVSNPASAGELSLVLVDGTGKPVPDAVVTVRPDAGIPAGPIRFAWPSTMVQQNIAFTPHVLIVPVGATVQFPNRDRVRHHIYSFSKPARFELKLYGREEARSYTFKSPGAVALGCNIHDAMSGFIKVVDTPWADKSDAGGGVRLHRLPAGAATLVLWHPRLRGRDNEVVMRIAVPANGSLAKQIALPLR